MKELRVRMLALILHIAETRRNNLRLLRTVKDPDVIKHLEKFANALDKALVEHVKLYVKAFNCQIIKL